MSYRIHCDYCKKKKTIEHPVGLTTAIGDWVFCSDACKQEWFKAGVFTKEGSLG